MIFGRGATAGPVYASVVVGRTWACGASGGVAGQVIEPTFRNDDVARSVSYVLAIGQGEEVGLLGGRQRFAAMAWSSAGARPNWVVDLDLKILEQLYRFKPAAIRELISTFIEHAGSQIADLERAMSQEDTEAISALAHSLKGSSGTIGASRMSDLCASLERQARETEMPTAVQDIADLAAEFDRVSGILESRLETWPAPGDATSKAAS